MTDKFCENPACDGTGSVRLPSGFVGDCTVCMKRKPKNKPDQPKRARIMQKGIDLTTGDRNASYGSPHPNLQTFAHLVNVYLKGLGWEGPKLDSVDGSMIMVLAKTSRVCVNKQHEDNYVDGSTYFAIAGECAGENVNIHDL